MFVVQELIRSLILLVNIVCTVLNWLLVIRIILSWFQINPYTTFNELLNVLFNITDAILAPFRRLHLQIGMLDLTPMVAFVALQFLQNVLVRGLVLLGGMVAG